MMYGPSGITECSKAGWPERFIISSIRLGISFQLILLNPISWTGQDVTTCVAVAVIFRVSVEVAISRSVIVSVTVKNSDMVDVIIISDVSVSVIVMVIVLTEASADELHWLIERLELLLLFGLELLGLLARRNRVKKLLKKLFDWALLCCTTMAQIITTNMDNVHLFMMKWDVVVEDVLFTVLSRRRRR